MKRSLSATLGLWLASAPVLAQEAAPYGATPTAPAPAQATTPNARLAPQQAPQAPAATPTPGAPPASPPTPTAAPAAAPAATPGAPSAPGTVAAPATPGTPAAPSAAPVAPPHPPLPAPQARVPHGAELVPDSSEPTAALPPGTIEVLLADENDAPLAGRPVELIIDFESVAQGPQQDRKTVTTNAEGIARFSGLSRELNYIYTVVAERDGGRYGVPGIRLKGEMGHAVRLHAYPTTSDPRRTFVGLRGFVFVQPRDDLFQVEVLFRVFNMSRTSWLPDNVVMRLPSGFTALDSPKEGDTGFVEVPGEGARLQGTFAPGQRDVRFSFQLPSRGSESQGFEMSLPPHLAELRVLTEAAAGMTLDVDGFERAQVARGPSGDRVLITRRVMRPGEEPLERVSLRIGGLPVPGPTRWGVVAAAAAIALAGLLWAFQHRGKSKGRHAVAGEDIDRARSLLLDELVALEQAFESGAIGPRTHEQTKRQLLDALARLELVPRLAEPKAAT